MITATADITTALVGSKIKITVNAQGAHGFLSNKAFFVDAATKKVKRPLGGGTMDADGNSVYTFSADSDDEKAINLGVGDHEIIVGYYDTMPSQLIAESVVLPIISISQ